MKCQYYNKTNKTETGLNQQKAKCKERGKLSDNNEHNILSTSNDSDATACAKIEYPWPETYNTILSNPIDTIYDKIAFWSKYLFLLPQVRVGRSICWCSYADAKFACIEMPLRTMTNIAWKGSEILCISPYLVRIPENIDQKKSEYGHFLRSDKGNWWIIFGKRNYWNISKNHTNTIINCRNHMENGALTLNKDTLIQKGPKG